MQFYLKILQTVKFCLFTTKLILKWPFIIAETTFPPPIITRSAIYWLCHIKIKQNCTFIQLDIKDLYSSVKENILYKTLTFVNKCIKYKIDQLKKSKKTKKSNYMSM